MRELEKDLKYIKGTNSELESELGQTRNLLKGSNKKDIRECLIYVICV
jgi:hypothetical protein